VTDLLMLALMVGFFSLAILFIRFCERIIGPDVEAARTDVDAVAEEPAA
jgi:hypothetical protein